MNDQAQRARLLTSRPKHYASLVLGRDSDSVDSATVRELGLSGLSELCRAEPGSGAVQDPEDEGHARQVRGSMERGRVAWL